MDTGSSMAGAAERFCSLVEGPPPADADARRIDILAALCDALAAAVRLGEVDSEEDPADRDPALSYAQARERLKWLPIGLYNSPSTLDPAQQPESSVGDALDDLADIYLDLGRGLAHWSAGERDHAVWFWRESFHSHWQHHAAGAIYGMTAVSQKQ